MSRPQPCKGSHPRQYQVVCRRTLRVWCARRLQLVYLSLTLPNPQELRIDCERVWDDERNKSSPLIGCTRENGRCSWVIIRKKWFFYYTQQDLFSQISIDFPITLNFTGFHWISHNLVNFKFGNPGNPRKLGVIQRNWEPPHCNFTTLHPIKRGGLGNPGNQVIQLNSMLLLDIKNPHFSWRR
jgi:hypothetical protein